MLFYCVWKGDDAPEPIVVDARDAKFAKDLAASLTDEPPPDAAIPIPGGKFSAHVRQVDIEQDLVWVLDPTDELGDLIDELEEQAAAIFGGAKCASEAEGDDGQVIHCGRLAGHEGPHQGEEAEW